jgi:hypothetical protein
MKFSSKIFFGRCNLKRELPNKAIAILCKNKYNNWKNYTIGNEGYFIIFNTYLEDGYLCRLSGGATKLFIYLGIVSKNDTGESFHSVESMAKYFDVSERTITTWIKELEKEKLIIRMQLELNGVSHTYLQPY